MTAPQNSHADVAATHDAFSSATGVALLIGKGDGTFLPVIELSVPFASSPVATADFNGDGLDDVATASSRDIYIILNKSH